MKHTCHARGCEVPCRPQYLMSEYREGWARIFGGKQDVGLA